MKLKHTIIPFLFVLGLLSCKKDPPAPLPVANFFVDNNGCAAPCTLAFFDQSQHAVSWEWDFGNGASSTIQDDSIAYDSSGSYEVWLYIENSDNVRDSIRKNVFISE